MTRCSSGERVRLSTSDRVTVLIFVVGIIGSAVWNFFATREEMAGMRTEIAALKQTVSTLETRVWELKR